MTDIFRIYQVFWIYDILYSTFYIFRIYQVFFMYDIFYIVHFYIKFEIYIWSCEGTVSFRFRFEKVRLIKSRSPISFPQRCNPRCRLWLEGMLPLPNPPQCGVHIHNLHIHIFHILSRSQEVTLSNFRLTLTQKWKRGWRMRMETLQEKIS